MLIRAETAGQSLRILGKKGRRGVGVGGGGGGGGDGGAEPRVKERGENRKAEEERSSCVRETVRTRLLSKRKPPAVHSRVTLS